MPNEVSSPKNLTEALKFLQSSKLKVYPFAGGTSLLLNPPDNAVFLNLEKLDLSYIKFDKKYLRIGAMTPVSRLIESAQLKKIWDGIIPECALTIATTPNRNLITAGGNAVGIHPWSALPGLILLLDGEILTAGKKTYKAKDFFANPPKLLLGNDIVTEIRLPLENKNALGGWRKFSLTETDYPLLSAGCIYEIRKNIIKRISLVAAGLTLLPQRFYKTEKMLAGMELNRRTIDSAVESIKSEAARISNDIRVPSEYKRGAVAVLLTDIFAGKQ